MTFEFLIGRGVKEEKIRGDWRRGDEDDFQSQQFINEEDISIISLDDNVPDENNFYFCVRIYV